MRFVMRLAMAEFGHVTAVTWSIEDGDWGVTEGILREVWKRMDEGLFLAYQTFVSRAAD